MSDPYVGEIRLFGGNFAPAGWAFCNGQPLPISENETLFQLIGTTYGGDGQETFNLPNLQSRVPLHQGTLAGNTYTIGQVAGTEQVTLTSNQIPGHSHLMSTTGEAGTTSTPSTSTIMADEGPSGISSVFAYQPFDGANQVSLNPVSVGLAGSSQPHTNIQPYLALSFIISLFGIFPTQN
jgi:microcystin-dependent protein